jgi:hypothetical protein
MAHKTLPTISLNCKTNSDICKNLEVQGFKTYVATYQVMNTACYASNAFVFISDTSVASKNTMYHHVLIRWNILWYILLHSVIKYQAMSSCCKHCSLDIFNYFLNPIQFNITITTKFVMLLRAMDEHCTGTKAISGNLWLNKQLYPINVQDGKSVHSGEWYKNKCSNLW